MSEAAFCPYVGLRPFHEEDQVYFFGREREIRAVCDNLFGARVTIFYGASGVGKSSVLMAGVVPELRKEPRVAVVVFRSWQIPHAHAQLKREVAATVAAVAGQPLPLDESLPLDELLKQAAEAIDGTVLLILDQFEEFFLYFKDPEAGFDAELARAITRRDVDAGFVLSLREDSLSKLDRFKKRVPTLLANTLRLFHLRLGAAKRGIVEPLKVYNERRPEAAGEQNKVAIEPALVEAVLEQTAPGQLSLSSSSSAAARGAEVEEGRVEAPFLQLVLERLWAEEIGGGSKLLRLETLERLGGAGKIVRTHLNEVLDRLGPQDQELCARAIDRLVTPSGAKIAFKLRDLAAYAGELAGEVPRIARFLDGKRILARTPAPAGSPEEDDQYQIFHDVLAPGFLAWRERFLRRRAQASAEAQAADRARAAIEEERRQHEESARKRELALAEERAAQERRLRKRFQYAMVGLAFMTVWAAIFGYNARRESQRANAAYDSADALRQKAEQSALAAQDAEREAKRAQARFELEKIRDAYASRAADREAALADLDRVIEKLDPRSAQAYALRGRVRLDRALLYLMYDESFGAASASTARQEIDRAIDDLDRSLELDLRQPAVLVTRAEARQAKGDLAGAIADYDAAIAMAPRDAQLLLNRGALRDRAGDTQGAIADYSAAIALNPKFDDAYLARAELLSRTNRPGEAIADFRRAAQYADDDRTRLAAKRRLADLGAAATPPLAAAPRTGSTVLIHFTGDSEDRRVAEAVKRALERGKFTVAGVQSVPGRRTGGDVRYIVTDDKDQTARDERVAAEIAQAVEKALAEAGFKVSMQTIALDAKRFPDAKPGAIEVWLPPLSSAVPQLQKRAL